MGRMSPSMSASVSLIFAGTGRWCLPRGLWQTLPAGSYTAVRVHVPIAGVLSAWLRHACAQQCKKACQHKLAQQLHAGI